MECVRRPSIALSKVAREILEIKSLLEPRTDEKNLNNSAPQET